MLTLSFWGEGGCPGGQGTLLKLLFDLWVVRITPHPTPSFDALQRKVSPD